MRVSRRPAAVLAAACLLAALPARGGADDGGWRELPSGLELRRLPGRPETGEPGQLTLLRLPAGEGLRIRVLAPGRPQRAGELAADGRWLAAVNANFFDQEGRALGWVVSDGREISALGRRGWGVLAVTLSGRLRVVRPGEAPPLSGTRQAVQAGPLLVVDGQPNPGLRRQTARRVFAGLDAQGRLVIGSTGAGLAEASALARLLARPEAEGGAGLRQVLNLDGGSSAQFWVRGGAEPEGDLHEPAFHAVPVLLAIERAP